MPKIAFKVDGKKLNGTVFYPEESREKNPAILFVHGWTGDQENSFQYAKALTTLGYICLLFDMRGHGKSEGNIETFTIKDFFDDVLAAYEFLLNVNGVDEKNISVVGSSFGAYLLPLLSNRKKLKNLVLRAPADYPIDIFDKPKMQNSDSTNPELVRWRKELKKPTESLSLQSLSKFSGNILIIESGKDDVVPHETILNYVNAVKNKNKLTHVLMKDAPHSLEEGEFRNKVEQILIDWFTPLKK